ncbi:MAG: SPASM domain-containing protein [Planctomycetota bacterium]
MIAENTSSTTGAARPSPLRFLDPRFYLDAFASSGESFRMLVQGVKRRQGWFLERMTFRRGINLAVGATQYALKAEKMLAFPSAVKIDISPMCNLSCTVCVHADPNGDPALEKQEFHPQHRMSVEQFRGIVKQIRGRSSAVSLYYVGDPLVHPDLDEMSTIAKDAGLNVHISTNFSFALTDARIRRMVKSGLTHLTVCVDGLSQAKYEMTRVGGRIDRVLNNLKRICEFRKEYGQVYPKVEVQYIKFQHNLDEVEPARKMLLDMGIDQFTDFFGDLGNYTDRDPNFLEVIGPHKNKGLPQCYWPHNATVIKYNGDVIPCCTYRIGHQYTAKDDPKHFGNVFETSLAEIWNSEKYRDARRMVNNPEVINSEPRLKDHFCYGCPAIYKTTDRTTQGMSWNVTWEERYEMDEHGRPVAKRRSEEGWNVSEKFVQVGLPNGEKATV